MANTNTFASAPGAAPFALNSATPTVILNASGAPLQVGLSNNANFDGGRPFTVRLRGTAKGGTAATLLLKLYLGTSATVASNTLVAAFTVSGAAIPVGGGNFGVSATLQWDSASQQINGVYSGQTNGTFTAAAALATAPTAVATQAAIQFVAVATFGAALATNSISVTEFSVEQA